MMTAPASLFDLGQSRGIHDLGASVRQLRWQHLHVCAEDLHHAWPAGMVEP